MPIPVECLECGEAYRVPDGAAGKRIRCKGCDGPISVPGTSGRARPQQRKRVVDHEDFDDDDDFDDGYDDPPPRRRSAVGAPRRRPSVGASRRSKSAATSGGGFRWGPLVALVGIPLLFIGFLIGGNENGAILGIVLMNVAFGVSSAISTVQKGHSVGLGIPLAFIGLLGLLVVAFLPDNSQAPARKGNRRRR